MFLTHMQNFNVFSKICLWEFQTAQRSVEARCDVVLKTTWLFHSPRPSYMQKKNYWMTLLRSFLRSKCWSSTLKNRRSWVLLLIHTHYSKLFSKKAKHILGRIKIQFKGILRLVHFVFILILKGAQNGLLQQVLYFSKFLSSLQYIYSIHHQ